MGDIVLYLIFLLLGVLIGLNNRSKDTDDKPDDLPLEVKKLQDKLQVMYNVRDGLLDDVKYWRSKAKDGNQDNR